MRSHLRNLQLFQFRSHRDLKLQFHHNIQVFIGPNGVGKTNILEAVYIFSQGQSFRHGTPGDWVTHGCSEGMASLQLSKNALDFSLRMKLQDRRKEFLMQEKKIRPAILQQEFPSVLFSPESLESIKGGAERRRLLIDEVVRSSLPQGAEHLQRWTSVWKQRNRLLRDIAQGTAASAQAEQVFRSGEPLFLTAATALIVDRLQVLEGISQHFSAVYSQILGEPNVELSVEYLISEQNLDTQQRFRPEKIQQILQQRALALQSAEFSTGTSLVGPHKHDIRFLVNGKDSRIFCSQGQQRALILAFKMAQIVYHRTSREVHPLLLLDDVFSELDAVKQRSFLAFLKTQECQVLLSSTELPAGFFPGEIDLFELQKGQA